MEHICYICNVVMPDMWYLDSHYSEAHPEVTNDPNHPMHDMTCEPHWFSCGCGAKGCACEPCNGEDNDND